MILEDSQENISKFLIKIHLFSWERDSLF